MTAVPDTLDRRFRDAASEAGLLDVSYDVTESPVGSVGGCVSGGPAAPIGVFMSVWSWIALNAVP